MLHSEGCFSSCLFPFKLFNLSNIWAIKGYVEYTKIFSKKDRGAPRKFEILAKLIPNIDNLLDLRPFPTGGIRLHFGGSLHIIRREFCTFPSGRRSSTVEQLIRNQQVGGSIPPVGSINSIVSRIPSTPQGPQETYRVRKVGNICRDLPHSAMQLLRDNFFAITPKEKFPFFSLLGLCNSFGPACQYVEIK